MSNKASDIVKLTLPFGSSIFLLESKETYIDLYNLHRKFTWPKEFERRQVNDINSE